MNSIQPKAKSRKRNILIASVLLTTVATISSPVLAKTIDASLLSSIFGASGIDIAPYLRYIQTAEDFYKTVATGNLKEILGEIAVASGELGIPIPTEVQKAIDLATAQKGQTGAFGIESVLLSKVLQGQADSKIAMTGAETLLSKNGQQRISDIKEITAQAAASSVQASQTSQDSIITQDVLKQITIQNTGTTAILKSIYDSTVDNQITNAQTSQAIGNMSKALTEEAWGKQVTGQASQVGLMDTTAQFAALVSPQKQQ